MSIFSDLNSTRSLFWHTAEEKRFSSLETSEISYSLLSGYYIIADGRTLTCRAALEALREMSIPQSQEGIRRFSGQVARFKTFATSDLLAQLRKTRESDLEDLLNELQRKVDSAFEKLQKTRMPAIKAAMISRQETRRLGEFVKDVAIAKLKTLAANRKQRAQEEAAIRKIDTLKKRFQEKKAKEKERNLAAFKIQRAYTRHLIKRVSPKIDKESGTIIPGERLSWMKVEYPLMAKMRKGTIREHQLRVYDGLFYRYMHYAKATGDIISLQRLSYAKFFKYYNIFPAKIALLINLLNSERTDRISTMVFLMHKINTKMKKILDWSVAHQDKKWADETALADFDNPKGKKELMAYSATGEAVMIPRADLGFHPWTSDSKVDPETEISFDHSGGYYSIQDFFHGIYHGYALEGRYGAGNSYGYGIQVHPYMADRERREFYAYRRTATFFDYPATVTGKIKAKYLQTAPNAHYEAGLRPEFLEHVTDLSYCSYPKKKETLPLTISRREAKSSFIKAKEGADREEAYHAFYGSHGIWSKVQVALTDGASSMAGAGAGR